MHLAWQFCFRQILDGCFYVNNESIYIISVHFLNLFLLKEISKSQKSIILAFIFWKHLLKSRLSGRSVTYWMIDTYIQKVNWTPAQETPVRWVHQGNSCAWFTCSAALTGRLPATLLMLSICTEDTKIIRLSQWILLSKWRVIWSNCLSMTIYLSESFRWCLLIRFVLT